MNENNPPRTASADVEPKHASTARWTPANGIEAVTTVTPASASSDEPRSPPAKRRREERERSRVSRACDRCKKLPSVIVDDPAIASDALASRRKESLASGTSAKEETAISTTQFPRIYPSPLTPIDPQSYSNPENSESNALGMATDQINRPSSRDSPVPQGAQRDQEGHYVGSSSAASFLIRIQKRLHTNSSLSHDSTIFTFGDAPLPEFDLSIFVPPPKPDAQRLVERYFDYAAPTHRFLHRPTIEQLVEEFYDTQGEMRSKEDGKAKVAFARYFRAAEAQLLQERGAVRLASVQARLLQCFYLLTQSRINHCWSLFGELSHLAFAIGLNRGRKCDPSTKVDYVEIESRRRLFWVAYSLDKYLAAALGRPRTFKDEDIDQELPTIVNDNDLQPNYINLPSRLTYSLMTAPVEHIKLTRIVSLVLRDLYSIRPPSLALRIELSSKYTSELHAWKNSLSGFLSGSTSIDRIDNQLLIPVYQRQRSVLNLAYHHALLLIHRPFLLRDFASLTHMGTHPNWSAGLSTTYDASANITACLEAAMSIVRSVDDVFKASNLFRSFWFTQYYAFCAVVVLYIHRIQQGLGVKTKVECEGYFEAGVKCQRQLETVSDTDCLAHRYCVVLEELRTEAVRQSGRLSTPVADNASFQDTSLLSLPMSAPNPDSVAPAANLPPLMYSSNNSNIDISDSAAVFNNTNNNATNPTFSFDLLDWSDFASWGQFEGLVTAGNGSFDPVTQSENDFWFGS
ncbi:uncharacterized protein J4E79_003606 [Alternaria viburni]|uniref:uncharacterized protein n=1 Tax=Alternaria viburni TaxID=566460 RepID=UPI0020C28D82|nr:uncharacterized protein J4E79_003606 [Alternaria viburni]KAI4664105.1 hypothetical protein J4E79_003606 [Alternaria viburni]